MVARRVTLAVVPYLIACAAACADEPSGNSAPNYNSDYAEAARAIPSMSGRTPEEDARPGEYYFRLGAAAFQHRDYTHAVRMYEVAASWAYKPAQFNLGVMYARGQGVPVDLPRAMAWLALAAERNDREYVDAKELVYAAMTKEQFEQANVLWRDLRKTYGDEAALPRAKARWADVRNNATGSHVGAIAGPLLVGAAPAHVAKLPPPDGAPGGAPAHVATEGADVFAGGDRTDGAVAYKQLRQSENPYDPKFVRPEIGVATVEPLQPVDGAKQKTDPASRH